MKKGYQCPRCGTKETEDLLVECGGSRPITVFITPQKILRRPDIRISCSSCGLLADADRFRTRRSGAEVNAS